jgi:hypothetical protein
MGVTLWVMSRKADPMSQPGYGQSSDGSDQRREEEPRKKFVRWIMPLFLLVRI